MKCGSRQKHIGKDAVNHLVGDFTSIYLAVSAWVDPTPVKTINYLKDTLKQNGFREKVIGELAKL